MKHFEDNPTFDLGKIPFNTLKMILNSKNPAKTAAPWLGFGDQDQTKLEEFETTWKERFGTFETMERWCVFPNQPKTPSGWYVVNAQCLKDFVDNHWCVVPKVELKNEWEDNIRHLSQTHSSAVVQLIWLGPELHIRNIAITTLNSSPVLMPIYKKTWAIRGLNVKENLFQIPLGNAIDGGGISSLIVQRAGLALQVWEKYNPATASFLLEWIYATDQYQQKGDDVLLAVDNFLSKRRFNPRKQRSYLTISPLRRLIRTARGV